MPDTVVRGGEEPGAAAEVPFLLLVTAAFANAVETLVGLLQLLRFASRLRRRGNLGFHTFVEHGGHRRASDRCEDDAPRFGRAPDAVIHAPRAPARFELFLE